MGNFTHYVVMGAGGWARDTDLRKALKACRKNSQHRAAIFGVYRCGGTAYVDAFGYLRWEADSEVEPAFDGWYNVHGYRLSTDPEANVVELSERA